MDARGERQCLQGTFDGAGKKISGLYNGLRSIWPSGASGNPTWTVQDTDEYNSGSFQGLFGRVLNGELCNIRITSGRVTGGIAGFATGSTITACSNASALTAWRLTGVVGSLSGVSTVTACYNTGTITSVGNSRHGGVVASITPTTAGSINIVACYNTGQVTEGSPADSLVGCIDLVDNTTVNITACYYKSGTHSLLYQSLPSGYAGNAAGSRDAKEFSGGAVGAGWPGTTGQHTEWGTISGANGGIGSGGAASAAGTGEPSISKAVV